LREPERIVLECLEFGWRGELMEDIANTIDQRLSREGKLYLLVEPALPFTDLNKLHAQHRVLARFERPFNGMVVELWQVFSKQN
jgi:hypothetical protein